MLALLAVLRSAWSALVPSTVASVMPAKPHLIPASRKVAGVGHNAKVLPVASRQLQSAGHTNARQSALQYCALAPSSHASPAAALATPSPQIRILVGLLQPSPDSERPVAGRSLAQSCGKSSNMTVSVCLDEAQFGTRIV